MTQQTEAQRERSKGMIQSVMVAVAMMAAVVAALAISTTMSSDRLNADVVTITQMNESEVSAMSIDEIQDARRTLVKVKGSDDYPTVAIERELEKLDAVLDQKLAPQP